MHLDRWPSKPDFGKEAFASRLSILNGTTICNPATVETCYYLSSDQLVPRTTITHTNTTQTHLTNTDPPPPPPNTASKDHPEQPTKPKKPPHTERGDAGLECSLNKRDTFLKSPTSQLHPFRLLFGGARPTAEPSPASNQENAFV